MTSLQCSQRLEQALTDVVVNSIKWSKKNSYPLFGTRRLAYILVGSSNGFITKGKFNRHHYWGSLAFFSVRKLESLFQVMLEQGVLEVKKSPKRNLPVIDVSDEVEYLPGLTKHFLEKKSNTIDENRNLFLDLKNTRRSIAKKIPKGKKAPMGYIAYDVCNDKLLHKICELSPRSVADFLNNPDLGKVHKYACEFVSCIQNFYSKQ